jgi:hypothetical protein
MRTHGLPPTTRFVFAVCLWMALLSLVPLRASHAADPPAKQPEITIERLLPSPTGLDESLVVVLSDKPSADPATARLFLRDREIKDLKPELAVDGRSLVFPLRMTAANKEDWGKLLGSPGAPEITLPVAVALGGQRLAWKSEPPTAEADKSVRFRVYRPWPMAVAMLLVAAAVVFVFYAAGTTTLLRDTLVPQIRISDRPFSLARSQMAWWFVLILASFGVVYVITGSTEAISSQALVLLGITSATTMGSALIDQSREGKAKELGPNLAALGFSTCADVETAVRTALNLKSGGWSAKDVDDARGKANAQIGELQASAAAPGLSQASITAINDQITALQGKLATISALAKYDALIADYRSVSWWVDVINDINGPTVHRLQIVVWTVTLGLIYVYQTYNSLQVPQFSDNLLVLMGISSGVYLGLKVPERQTS